MLAALNRAVAATSKAQLATWYQRTSLPRWMKLQAGQLASQHFWDNMDRVSEDAPVAIERELTARVVKEFQLDLRCLFVSAA